MSLRPFRFAAALGVASMGCAEEAQTGGMWRPDFPMVPAASPSPPAPPQDLHFVSAHEAEQRGLTGERAVTTFGEGEDGNKLLDDFVAKARRHGAVYVSDVTLYFASSQEGSPRNAASACGRHAPSRWRWAARGNRLEAQLYTPGDR